ncbi:ATP-binding cassette subfamily B multidrug efflux pump [Mycoplasmoides fastidiosum]|uniref:ATP-binding cassette subfamily B multidrug efflux pump n=1 Tax=Mycoplasmoides fastidiosum TaxID=92758 RepID=A0ABU0LZ15_9BACT|nr:ABC transporter ATP-binding protein [Mycoplasmoides fastidiosum]MDQ0513942.1 ATP-binding cassette subfamily B multidrug efflux pump [Mycoplasmoides fastidiosum]UUD37644.1 ABC transporter ATP-binding protein/permease [Mycoplasmoides fastidiosum]
MLRATKQILKKHYKIYFLAQFLFFIQVIADITTPLLLQQLINNLYSPQRSLNTIILIGVGMLAVNILSFFMGVTARIISARLTIGFGKEMRLHFYQKITTFTYADLNVFPSSTLISRIGKNLNNMINWLTWANQVLLRAIFMFIGGILATIVILYTNNTSNNFNPNLANQDLRFVIILIVILFIILNFSFIWLAVNKSRKLFFKTQTHSERLNRNIQETFLGIRFIKSYNLENLMFENNARTTEELRKGYVKTYQYENLFGPVINLIMASLTLTVIWTGVHFHLLDLAQIIAITQTLAYLVLSIILATWILSNLGRANVSAKRVYDVLDFKTSMHFLADSQAQKPANTIIKFKDVNFAYFKEAENSLSNINLEIPANQILGIIGRTGSGKSTLVNLIPRLYDATSGVVEIGGVNVKNMNLQALRNLVTVVPQKNNLFSGTIAFNLNFAKENLTTEEMWEALELACAADFVKDRELQLEARVEQRGSNFSGGQKQRLCIARALLKQAKILIFDDSTSALDARTEKQLISNLKQLKGVTKIIVSQKISSIIHADQILVLDQGQIIDIGKHEELIRRCDIYSRIYQSQTGGE